ncbi:MAG: holo-ACP synthase [Tenericutes bacterium]|nr:holo-ACP synthase [Mycoplasmatota bacterium]
MIAGIGVDILQISRIKLEHARRVLSEEELNVFDSILLESKKLEYLAGRFSVKEAIIKAIGKTKYKVGMREITIVNDETGMPILKQPIYNDIKIFISLSHEKDNCIGFCIIENV